MNRAQRAVACFAALLLLHGAAPGAAGAYVINSVVADMRQPSSVSGGTSCPQPTEFNVSVAGGINTQWSTSLGTTPATILTSNQTTSGRIAEIAATIAQSYSVWTSVSGSSLTARSLGPLNQTGMQDACAVDGLNTICLNQSDPGFTTGVLAFTRVLAADEIGANKATVSSSPSTFIGQILDADILVRPGDSTSQFATPAALSANPSAYDLESILLHEMGHQFGLADSGVWRAMMFPYAPPVGTYLGSRPTTQSPTAPLGDDDRSAVRVLYHNPSDNTYIGSISGRVLPANTLALAGQPAGTTGIVGAQVVAVNSATGAVESGGDFRLVLQQSRAAGLRRQLHDRRLGGRPILRSLRRAARRPGEAPRTPWPTP